MKSVTPFLLLPFLAMACKDEGPTNPLDGPELHQLADKPDKPDKGAQYEFAYPREQGNELGSDCWYPIKDGPAGDNTLNPYGYDFRCPIDLGADPVLKFQVVDGNGEGVSDGTVTFWRCEDSENNYQPLVVWHYCGVRQTGKKPYRYQAVQYRAVDILEDGEASVKLYLADRVVLYDKDRFPNQPEELGWGGMRWYYDAGDGGKPELGSGWRHMRPFPKGSME